jgi:hypothetical protein
VHLQAAKDVVLANKPIITDDSATLEPALLKTLMEQISTLASVYHKPADTFVSRQRLAVQTVDSMAGRAFEEEEAGSAAAAAQVGPVSMCLLWLLAAYVHVGGLIIAVSRCCRLPNGLRNLLSMSGCSVQPLARYTTMYFADLALDALALLSCRLLRWTALLLLHLLRHLQHLWWTCWVMICWAAQHQQQHQQLLQQQVCLSAHTAAQACGTGPLTDSRTMYIACTAAAGIQRTNDRYRLACMYAVPNRSTCGH